jgi:APA family basic amino acid/polyamine antiporter
MTFGIALIPILFAYGGWQVSTYLAEEMRDPVRHLPRSLIIGTLSVVAIYLLVNVAYLRTLGLDGLAATTTPAAETAGRWFGATGERFVAAAIAISTFGFLSLSVLAPTRVYYAMAADGAFLPALAKLHPKYGVPAPRSSCRPSGRSRWRSLAATTSCWRGWSLPIGSSSA